MFGIRDFIVAASAASILWVAFSLYDANIDDPAVRREARAACVSQAELSAAEAQLAEERRRAAAAEAALQAYRDQAARDAAAHAAELAEMERENAEYEQKLADAGRACLLDSGDVDWLLGR